MTSNINIETSSQGPDEKRPVWSSLLQLVVDRNPFYLLSAACMLGGCLALTNSFSWSSLPLQRLLLLIGTINFYEGALIGLAILLLGRGLLRDGRILLILEAFFLVDVTFLNAEIVTANLHVGIVIAVVLFLLAGVKLRLVMYALKAKLSAASFVHVMVQIAALLAVPCVLRGLDHGSATPIQFYAVWWVIGLMPAIGIALRWAFGGTPERLTGPVSVFLALPWISLIAHLGILHYVYDVPFFRAMAAPVLLACAFILKRANDTRFTPKTDLIALQLILSLSAVLVSLNNPHELAFSLPFLPSMQMTPTLLAAGATYLTCVYCFLLPIAFWCLMAGAAAAALYVFGPTASQMQRFAWQAWCWFVDVTDWMIPKSVSGWGILSVLASFFFLVIGAAISLLGGRVVVRVVAEPPRKIEIQE